MCGVFELGMDACEQARQQAVARHGEPDARLAVLKHQQRTDHAHQRAHCYREPDSIEPQSLQSVRHRRGVVQRVPVGDAGQHQGHGDVEHRADYQGQ